MKAWVEIRPSLRRFEKITLVPMEDAYKYTGFRSVFGLTEEGKRKCWDSGRSAGLAETDLICDTLFLDFDNNVEAEDQARNWLNNRGVEYSEYHTGGRGAHFHVPVRLPDGCPVASVVKRFVRDNFPGADLSIYKTSGIFRLPGTFHEKNPGRYKHLVRYVAGKTLSIQPPPMDVPLPRFYREEESLSNNEAFFRALFTPVSEGGRNNKVFILGCLARASGLDEDEAIATAHKYNAIHVNPPLDPREVEIAIRSSYNGVRQQIQRS